jgi:hypothetical protein
LAIPNACDHLLPFPGLAVVCPSSAGKHQVIVSANSLLLLVSFADRDEVVDVEFAPYRELLAFEELRACLGSRDRAFLDATRVF